jgi:peptidoglycan hydrolase-like protein with peptidoglycan-binding domain
MALLHVGVFSAALTAAKAQDSQEQLRAVQRALQVKGYDVGFVDGIMGPRTEAALEEFQRKSGLAVTGIADAPTLRALTVTEVPPVPRPETPAARQQAQPTPPYQYPTAPNSQTPPSTTQRVPATPPPARNTGSNSSGWIVLLALLVAGVVLWRRSRAPQQPVTQPRSQADAPSGGFRIVVTSDPASPRRPPPSISGPSAGTLKEQSERCWVRGGRSLKIAGYEIRGGLLYVGKELDRQNGGGVDNCLINPADSDGSRPPIPI